MKRHEPTDIYQERAGELMRHITKFFNLAYGRNVKGSRLLQDAIAQALSDRYTPDEIRAVYWIARCLTGKSAWLGTAMRTDMLPDIALRHQGGTNPVTGKQATRWLDDLLSRAGEVNPALSTALLAILPEEMRQAELELLHRMGVPING